MVPDVQKLFCLFPALPSTHNTAIKLSNACILLSWKKKWNAVVKRIRKVYKVQYDIVCVLPILPDLSLSSSTFQIIYEASSFTKLPWSVFWPQVSIALPILLLMLTKISLDLIPLFWVHSSLYNWKKKVSAEVLSGLVSASRIGKSRPFLISQWVFQVLSEFCFMGQKQSFLCSRIWTISLELQVWEIFPYVLCHIFLSHL
jgi:hypothetical protein